MTKTLTKLLLQPAPVCQAILFDLDGTLLDTAADLGLALNSLLSQYQRPQLPAELVRPLASHGTHRLLSAGFADDYTQASQQQQNQLKQEFFTHYANNICVETQWFSGMSHVLEQLQQLNIMTGIITNKPQRFTQPLVTAFPLLAQMPVVISGDTLTVAKPHPEPLLYAAQQLQLQPEHCWYVGDAERDIQAGRAAGMTTFLAEWGYISAVDTPHLWGADYRLGQPQDLLRYLDKTS